MTDQFEWYRQNLSSEFLPWLIGRARVPMRLLEQVVKTMLVAMQSCTLQCWSTTRKVIKTALRPSHTTKIFTKIFQKNLCKNLCPYIKLLKKSLQLWKKVVVCTDDNCFFCSFSCSVRGPLYCKHRIYFLGWAQQNIWECETALHLYNCLNNRATCFIGSFPSLHGFLRSYVYISNPTLLVHI